MTSYQEVFAEAARIWRTEGGISGAIQYLERAMEAVPSEDRIRVLNDIAKYKKRDGKIEEAYSIAMEAASQAASPVAKVDALCNSLDACHSLHRIEAGLRIADQILTLLPALTEQERLEWEPPYLYNLGMIYVTAGDFAAAQPRLSRARTMFMESGRKDQAWYVQAILADVQRKTGDLDAAEEACREVIAFADSPQVRDEAASVLGAIESDRGNEAEAERLWDKVLGSSMDSMRDKRTFLRTLTRIAEAQERRGEVFSARVTRALVKRLAAVSQIDGLSERG